MHIWIDGQCFQTASRTRGIGRYVTEFLASFKLQFPEAKMSISFNASMPMEGIVARNHLESIFNNDEIHVWQGLANSGEAIGGFNTERILSELIITHHVNCIAPDVAISASPFEGSDDFAVPLLPNPLLTLPCVSIFYDAIPYRFPDKYLVREKRKSYYERRLKKIGNFDLNLCISDFSKRELLSIHPQSIGVNIGAGISSSFSNRLLRRSKTDKNTNDFEILFVGAIDWRKNVRIIPAAIKKLPVEIRNKSKLLIVGNNDQELIEELEKQWNNLALPASNIIFKNFVSDEELFDLYKKSDVLVQPSYMEGFGLTALEALMIGTPVLAANKGALPEVICHPELLFNPESVTELSMKLCGLYRSPKSFKSHMKSALKAANKHTWNNSSATAHNALLDIITGHQVDLKSLKSNRKAIKEELKLDGKLSLIFSKAIAASEIPKRYEKRLLLEVTETTISDLNTGIQRVVKSLSKALESMDGTEDSPNVHFVFCDEDEKWVFEKNNFSEIPDKQMRNRVYPTKQDTLFLLDSSWSRQASQLNRIIEHRLRGSKIISCLYDTVPLASHAFTGSAMPVVFDNWFQNSLKFSNGFVCISKAVADELLGILEAIEFPHYMKIGYWQLGANIATTVLPQGPKDNQMPRRFLMVGTVEPRKGYQVALDAFDQLWDDGENVELVIVGKAGWNNDHVINRIKAHHNFNHRLLWYQSVIDEKLCELYSGADALISTSFTEGFGLPLVEAGYFGKPVIVSDIPVFREVVKGAAGARFFKVGSSTDLEKKIHSFLKKPITNRNREKENQWPNWDESAQQLLNIIENDKWYEIYIPKNGVVASSPEDIGKVKMTSPLPEEKRKVEVEIIEGPIGKPGTNNLDYILKYHNPTNILWSSNGSQDGTLGINFSYSILNKETNSVIFRGSRVPIPFVFPPQTSQYVRITVPIDKLTAKSKIEFTMVQEGVSWFKT